MVHCTHLIVGAETQTVCATVNDRLEDWAVKMLTSRLIQMLGGRESVGQKDVSIKNKGLPKRNAHALSRPGDRPQLEPRSSSATSSIVASAELNVLFHRVDCAGARRDVRSATAKEIACSRPAAHSSRTCCKNLRERASLCTLQTNRRTRKDTMSRSRPVKNGIRDGDRSHHTRR